MLQQSLFFPTCLSVGLVCHCEKVHKRREKKKSISKQLPFFFFSEFRSLEGFQFSLQDHLVSLHGKGQA